MTDFGYQKQAQDYYSKAPVIILGSGASMAFGLPGMGELAEHIKANVNTSAIPIHETGSWSEFCGLLDTGIDLEAALQIKPTSKLNLQPSNAYTASTYSNPYAL